MSEDREAYKTKTPMSQSDLEQRVIILATELAETWWTALYFERDGMMSFDAEEAGIVKAKTEYENFMPQARKCLDRMKL